MPDWKHYLDLIDKNITNFKNCTRIIKDDELDAVEVHEVIKNAEKEYVEAFKNFEVNEFILELSSIRNSSDENLSHLKELYFRKLDNLKNSYIQLKNDYKHQKMSSGGTLPLHADRSREKNLAHRKNENLLKLIQKLHEQVKPPLIDKFK
ncbi:hypothetical protein RF11_06762 [Thelohanellus kitauei]|uniref:Uncharacterized protein n=1 Tax=Thelohanellus kitauei TaxID=669202 RepID=A0A0C2IS91_THEKT|nr:hypothetical protein RF11_06762 [Thelohanellus kitauei]